MYFIASFSFLLLLCIESTYSHFSCVCIDVKTLFIHLHFLSADRHQWARSRGLRKVLARLETNDDFTRLSEFIDEKFLNY